jgi:alkylation response protein AidB-like acyl-CoA dehydrogenase
MSDASAVVAPDVLRREAREWLDENAPERGGPDDFSGIHLEGASSIEEFEQHERHVYDTVRAWQRKLVDAGWGGLSWPEEFGGRGLPEWADDVFADEQSRYGVSTKVLATTLQMVPPALLRYGTTTQQKRFLPPMLRADEVWCQLFSEPDAGSDLASLTTRAEPDRAGGWCMNGQKVWTSGAGACDLGIALARTTPGSTGRAGLTCFAVDMRDPGVEIRPLREMTGAYHFNEVFLHDVAVAPDHVIGDAGDGWTVARTVLTSERAAIGGGTSGRTATLLRSTAGATGRAKDPHMRQAVAQAYIRERVLDLHLLRVNDGSGDASIVKLMYSEHARLTASAGLAALECRGLAPEDDLSATWIDRLLFAPGLRIGGGTDEIQRNVIAERTLGLPRDPKPSSNWVGPHR